VVCGVKEHVVWPRQPERCGFNLLLQPLFVELFGRLGALALLLLRSLAGHVVQGGGPCLSWSAFISGALRELGVALCRCNASLGRPGLYGCPVGPRCSASLVPRLRLSVVAFWTVALADLCGCVWSLSRMARACLRFASALRLLAPMLLGVSSVPLCNYLWLQLVRAATACYKQKIS
jgi:hypothetical protein